MSEVDMALTADAALNIRHYFNNRNTELISAVILANLTMNYTAYSTQTVQ